MHKDLARSNVGTVADWVTLAGIAKKRKNKDHQWFMEDLDISGIKIKTIGRKTRTLFV